MVVKKTALLILILKILSQSKYYNGQPIETTDIVHRLHGQIKNPEKEQHFLAIRSNLPVCLINSVPSTNNGNIAGAPITELKNNINPFVRLPWYKDQIDKNMDFITPFNVNKGLKIPVIDYSIREIIDTKKKLKSEQKFVYFSMYLISEILEFGKKLSLVHEINKMKLNGKILIMPLFHENNHAVVLIADTKKKVAQYYDPNDPYLTWTKPHAEKRFKRFITMMERRNKFFIPIEEVIDMNRWQLKAPEIKLERQVGQRDCAIHAIQFIDRLINGKLKFRGNIDDYRRGLQNEVIKKVLNYDDKQIAIARNTWKNQCKKF